MTTPGAELPMVKLLARLCLLLLRRLDEIGTELRATWIALAEKGIVITAEEMRAAREAVHEVAELEQAMKPEGAAELANSPGT